MSNFNINESKQKINEVKKEIIKKKEYASQLEKNKMDIINAETSVQGCEELDDSVQRKILECINNELEVNSEKAKEASDELGEQLDILTEEREKTEDSIAENESESKKLEETKNNLSKFGLGKSMENAIGELEKNRKELGDLKEFIIESEHELSDVSNKLNVI